MKFSFENQGSHTYLVYTFEEDDTIDSMSLGMLTNNKIQGLAQTFFLQMNDKKYIKYNISAKISVSQFFTGTVNKKRLIGVFKGIVDAMISAEDFMLDAASIVLDLDYIFTDVSTCETDLICLPIIDLKREKNDLGLFFRNIMFKTQFDQTENCDHVAKIINYLNGTPMFSLIDFKKVLEELQDQKVQPAVNKVKIDVPVESVVESQLKKQSQPTMVQRQAEQKSKNTLPSVNTMNPADNSSVVQKAPETTPPDTTGPEISFLYLMQHYNKENAAAYKAQKAAKKKAGVVKGQVAAKQSPVPSKAQASSQPVKDLGFAIPGQASNPIPKSTPKPMQPVQTEVATTTTAIKQQSMQQAQGQQPAYVPRQVPQGQAANFGETTVLGGAGIGETTVLSAMPNQGQAITPHLIRSKNNEKISVNKPVYRIGKEKSYVDYFIGDNTAISRSHANIISREGEYFVVDTNSTNHTFVNGGMINSNEEIRITHGDKIRLANEDFEFKLY